jgi:hypothetical protein
MQSSVLRSRGIKNSTQIQKPAIQKNMALLKASLQISLKMRLFLQALVSNSLYQQT